MSKYGPQHSIASGPFYWALAVGCELPRRKRMCKQCKEYKLMTESTKTPRGWFCSIAHATEYGREKAKVDLERKRKSQHAADRERVRPIGYWMKKAQAAFNAYIRERDRGEPCISCDKPDNGQHQRHASHYRSVGSSPATRFDELNVWASCSVCNNHLSGNLVPYRAALIEKIGLEGVERLEQEQTPKRYRKEDYQAIEKEYKTKLKEIRAEK